MTKRKYVSPLRLVSLIFCFTAAAAAACFLWDVPEIRLVCMPEERTLTAAAWEMTLWLAASLTTCAAPLFAALTIYRGLCFGLTISTLTAGTLTTPTLVPVYTYAACTLILCLWAAGTTPTPKTIPRFLPCAGMVFAMMMIG